MRPLPALPGAPDPGVRGPSFFAPGGALSRAHPRFEHRPGQTALAEAVGRTLDDGGILLAEAGTGTGKTLAYLVPALASGRRVIVSTGTKNLQDQIVRQDLPLLAEKAGLDLNAAVLKGRENYLCRYRFAEFRQAPLLEVAAEARYLEVLRAWAGETQTGDRADVPDLPDTLRMWRDVDARAETCGGTKCPEYEACFLTRAKRRAQAAQLVVVNHHLFFADLGIRSAYGAVLPDYDAVIFDEAHLLEEVATLYFGARASSGALEEIAKDAERWAAKEGGPKKGGGGAALLRQAAADFFSVLRERLRFAEGRVRFDPPERGGPDLEAEWATLCEALDEVSRVCGADAGPGDLGDAVSQRAQEAKLGLDAVLERTDPGFVYGVEARGKNVLLSAAPIDVSRILREKLWTPLHAAVLTSATLAVESSFAHIRNRLGIEDAEDLVVESPFDVARQAVLYLPRGMPEPRERGFTDKGLEQIEELLELTRGRAFLLFTSYASMERFRRGLLDSRWNLLVQGEGSKAALVDRFKETEDAVLLGTTSFWHGVDVPGEALSLVVVDKLPFDVPDDPLVAARIERIREEGGNPFREYQLPMAVLELKQGLGRLLRSTADRGILAVLDPRLTERPYGKTFLRSLPPYPIVRTLDACREFFETTGRS